LCALDFYKEETSPELWQSLLLGTSIAGLSAYVCIRAFITWVDRVGMMPFVIYRVLLGIVLFVIYYAI